jgi:hypothetical protein
VVGVAALVGVAAPFLIRTIQLDPTIHQIQTTPFWPIAQNKNNSIKHCCCVERSNWRVAESTTCSKAQKHSKQLIHLIDHISASPWSFD